MSSRSFPPKCSPPILSKSEDRESRPWPPPTADENPKSAAAPLHPSDNTIKDDTTTTTMVESSLDCDANNIGGDDENAVDVSSSSLAAAVAAEAELVVVAVADANADAEQVGVDAIVMDDNPAILPPNDNTTSAAILGEGGDGGELALAAPALPATPARHAHASWAADSLTAAPSSSSSSLRTTSSLLRPLAADLFAYFATLSKTVLRRTTTTIVAGDTTHAAASTTSTITTSTASSSSIAVILWEGVGPILAAGQHDNINVMSCDSSSSSTTFADDGGGISSIEGEQTSISRLITPQQAALYLYTVSQNIVALESAVLGTFSNVLASNAAAAAAAAADGGTMGGTTAMKKIMANQVAEIVSVSCAFWIYTTAFGMKCL